MKRIPAAALAVALFALPASARAEETDFRAWGRILRKLDGGRRCVVEPEHGNFVAGTPVELYVRSERLCSGTVASAYPDLAYVDLEERCFEGGIDLGRMLVTMNCTWHEISGKFVAREGEVMRDEADRRARGVSTRLGAVRVRPGGREGLSFSFRLLDAAGNPVDGEGVVLVRVHRADASAGDALCRMEYPVRPGDFRVPEDGGGLSWTGKIRYYDFRTPPPREAGAKGRLDLRFRFPDGTVLTESAEFPFDRGESPRK
jgi:hypothetical protein